MAGYIDLHSHWIAGIDDGARTPEESYALLKALREAGFSTVVATPHMRPGMFDNTREDLETAFQNTRLALGAAKGLPEVLLASEHFFDDIVFQRMMDGAALPYPGGHAILVEFPPRLFPGRVTHRFFDLRRKRLRPVLAHPERYEPVWRDRTVLDPLIEGGTLLLLDVAALAGKYGRAPRNAAEDLLEDGYYYAACSDAHSAKDVTDVIKGISLLEDRVGREEASFMLSGGPQAILDGRVEE
jgi:protein-tyrosine phosphatase